MNCLEHWLECQECGDRLIELSNSQIQAVANNPYNYVIYCRDCRKDIINQLEREEYGGFSEGNHQKGNGKA